MLERLEVVLRGCVGESALDGCSAGSALTGIITA